MKAFVKEFLKRGAIFCGLGPLILAIVYIFLANSNVVETVAVSRLIIEIISSLVMAFIAAGISAIYTVEKIQYPVAGLIQGSVLLIDYLGIYLLNGWLPFSWLSIGLFVAIFAVAFLGIYLIIYFSIKNQIKRMNSKIQ